MSEHTPGPWEVFLDDDFYPGIEAKDRRYSIIVFGDEGGDCGVQGKTHEEALANARLIAAAPDLLEALWVFAEIDECGIGVMVGEREEHTAQCSECQQILAARAAIAKAEGRA